MGCAQAGVAMISAAADVLRKRPECDAERRRFACCIVHSPKSCATVRLLLLIRAIDLQICEWVSACQRAVHVNEMFLQSVAQKSPIESAGRQWIPMPSLSLRAQSAL